MKHQITVGVGEQRHVYFGGGHAVEVSGGDAAVATFKPDDDEQGTVGGLIVGEGDGTTEFVLKRGAAAIVVEVVVGEGANDLIHFSADEAEPVPPPAEEHVEEPGMAALDHTDAGADAVTDGEAGEPEHTA